MSAPQDLEKVVREQISRVVANALQSGVPSNGIMNRATEAILECAAADTALHFKIEDDGGVELRCPWCFDILWVTNAKTLGDVVEHARAHDCERDEDDG